MSSMILSLISMNLSNSNNPIIKSSLEKRSDLSWIISFDASEMDYPWNEAMWNTSKNNPNMYLYSYLDKSGFCLFEKSDVFHIYKIVISSEFRRLGLAAGLIESLKIDAAGKDIYLEVSDHNQVALKFYQSMGFRELFHQKKFYSDGSGCFKLSMNTPEIDF